MDYINSQKLKPDFVCEICDYKTVRKNDYNNHLLTAKHKRITNEYNELANTAQKYSCNCGKGYKNRQGLYKHRKCCTFESNKQLDVDDTKPAIDVSLVIDLLKQNKELQNLLIHQAAEYAQKQLEQANEYSQKQSDLMNKLMEREPANNINTINGNVTNNNNNKFNLNFFLNETCKDAMTIQEFMENIRITFQDLLKIGDEGFVNGVSDIFIKQLKNLDVSKRPIHCTDSKRETIYFKEEDVWNKDDKDKTRLKQLIEKVEYRNVVALRDWCNENPDAKVNNTPNNLLKDKIYLQTLQGDDKTRDKIIKNISKEVMVEKE